MNKPLLPSRDELRAAQRRAFVTAMHLRAQAGREPSSALARDEAKNDARVALVIRGSIPALATTDPSGDALLTFQRASAAWLETLASAGIFDAMLADARVLPMMVRGGVVTTGYTAQSVDEGMGVPVTQLTVAAADPLRPVRATALAIATAELLRQEGVGALLDNELRIALAVATDRIFLDGLIAAGGTPIASVDATTDLAAALAAITTSGASRLFFAVRPEDAKALAVERSATGVQHWPLMGINGGQLIPGVRVVPTDGLDAGTAVLFDAHQIGVAPGQVELDTTGQADIEMVDPATIASRSGSPPAPVPASVTSMFQTNSVATRVQRVFGFRVLGSAAVASLYGVNYAGGGSP